MLHAVLGTCLRQQATHQLLWVHQLSSQMCPLPRGDDVVGHLQRVN